MLGVCQMAAGELLLVTEEGAGAAGIADSRLRLSGAMLLQSGPGALPKLFGARPIARRDSLIHWPIDRRSLARQAGSRFVLLRTAC
jgi:hypothetical protein